MQVLLLDEVTVDMDVVGCLDLLIFCRCTWSVPSCTRPLYACPSL